MQSSASRLDQRRAQFDAFEFDLVAGRLRRDADDLKLGSRAAALLRVLLEKAGSDVGKGEISDAVWPGVTVEDVNIRVQVSAIRKALGDQGGPSRYISNVAGRGYRWIAPTRFVQGEVVEPAVSRLIGRDAELREAASALSASRLVTIVGTGGIGKTSLAREALANWSLDRDLDAQFIDLAAVSDAAAMGDAIRAAVRAPNVSPDAAVSIVAAVADMARLIVLDNLEHVIDAARPLVVRLLAGCPNLRILATSREALGVEQETVLELAPLDFPRPGDRGGTDVESLLGRSAVALFVERLGPAAAAEVDHRTLLRIASICRQLDGVPLAIELVASQARNRDVEAVSRALADEASGARAPEATPRHRSLHAALDWSYRTLDAQDRQVLRAASVFRSLFTADDIAAILPGGDHDAAERLASKSIFARADGGYRLLETMRDFALGEAEAAKELASYRRAHAELMLSLFSDPPDWDAALDPRWPARLDDIRAALDWLLDQEADPALGCALLARSAPLWLGEFLFFEYRDRIERALPFRALAGPYELSLTAAFAAISFSTGGQIPRVIEEGHRALALAEAAADPVYELRARWALVGGAIFAGDYRASLVHARRYFDAAQTIGMGQLSVTGRRMLARAYNYLGDQREAQIHAEAALASAPKTRSRNIFMMDHRIMALGNLGRILWFRGLADQARCLVADMITEVEALGHAPTTCLAVAENGCNVALWCGDRPAAQRAINLLRTTADTHFFPRWQDWAHRFEEGYDLTDPDLVDAPVVRRYWVPPTLFHAFHAAALHPALVSPEALAAVERDESLWCAADILRGTAEQIMGVSPDAPALDQAEAMIHRASRIASEQGALSLELRAALSLHRLRVLQGRRLEGREAVARVLRRFTEGFDTIDVTRAQAICA